MFALGNSQWGGSVQQWNCPTQAKTGLEWATPAPASYLERKTNCLGKEDSWTHRAVAYFNRMAYRAAGSVQMLFGRAGGPFKPGFGLSGAIHRANLTSCLGVCDAFRNQDKPTSLHSAAINVGICS